MANLILNVGDFLVTVNPIPQGFAGVRLGDHLVTMFENSIDGEPENRFEVIMGEADALNLVSDWIRADDEAMAWERVTKTLSQLIPDQQVWNWILP